MNHIIDRATVNLEQIPTVQLPLANRFYADSGLRVKCGRHEQVYCLRSTVTSNSPIIAAVRFVPAGDYFIMRNLCVDPNWRRQGLARLLMQATLPKFEANIFCFSFGHLESFYQSVGFLTLADEPVPGYETRVPAHEKRVPDYEKRIPGYEKHVPSDIAKAYQSYSQKFSDLALMGLFNG